MAPKIRLATALDLDAMADCRDACWQETYGDAIPDDVREQMASRRERNVEAWGAAMRDGAHFWVAIDGDAMVGLAHAEPRRDADIDVLLELSMIYLRRSVQGIGLGSALLKTAIGDADAYLWVTEGDEPANTFFRRHGFEPDGAVRSSVTLRDVRMVRLVRRQDPDAG